jgi:hypothetical protein
MLIRRIKSEMKWVLLSLVVTFVLLIFFSVISYSPTVKILPHTFLGLNLFLEILVFFAFSIFVVFGIKGFFEMYSQKFANTIILTSGVILLFAIFILSYQILILG